ncbi:MAG: radical SAM family heme chaperone HemW [Pseudomonadota bacterium]
MVDRQFGLYVHWPFCQAKCPYCDFNSHVVSSIDQAKWAAAYEAEIARVKDDKPDAVLNTVFFGGGTPSLMAPETLERVMRKIRETWPVANDFEVTLEANPTSAEAARFQAYAALGVNRVSIGVQALNDEDLRSLGRLHNADEAVLAVNLAKASFDRVSFDLIYARQNQTLTAWEAELREALDLAVDHLSLYQLTIEPGTAFGDRLARGGLAGLPEEDLAADMYELTQELTAGEGLHAYEVSNHSKPGAESRHNLIYWRAGDWLGIGPGAHGRFMKDGKRIATETHLAPVTWLGAVAQGSGEVLRSELTSTDQQAEELMMGLRLSEGVPQHKFSELYNKFNALVDDGLINDNNGRFRATPSGRLVLNALLRHLLA